jgi:parvulin-like peptidyl-prolyl isomerase
MFLISASWLWPESNLTINRIVAVVDNEVITQSEMDKRKTLMLKQMEQFRSSSDSISEEGYKELEETILGKLITDRLILQEARRQQIEVTEAQIEEKIKNVKKNFPSRESFEESLSESGLTIEDLKKSYELELIMEKIFFGRVRHEIVVNPREVDEFYAQHKEEFVSPETVKLSNILIKKEGRSAEEVVAKLEAIISLLREGADFKEIVQKYSEGANAFKGGEMGEIKRGELSGQVEDIIFSLKPGQISEWIETSSGFYLFKIKEHSSPQPLDFSQAQTQIKNILFNQKMHEKLDKWIASLKEKAYINIYAD